MPDRTGPHLRHLTIRSPGRTLAAHLYLPDRPPLGGLLVCHGAGSCKENHAPMGEQAAAAGLAALVFDFRGHGESGGRMDADADEDVLAAAAELRRHAGDGWIAARGSSLGAYWLLRAARRAPDTFASLTVLCPADEASLLAGLETFAALPRGDRRDAGLTPAFAASSLRQLWTTADLSTTAAGLAGVLLAHARDDDEVPVAVSHRLAGVLAPPWRLITLARGGHKGPQRSPVVARATLEWAVERAAGLSPGRGAGPPRRPAEARS